MDHQIFVCNKTSSSSIVYLSHIQLYTYSMQGNDTLHRLLANWHTVLYVLRTNKNNVILKYNTILTIHTEVQNGGGNAIL